MIEIPLWLVALVGLLLVAGSLSMLLIQRQKKPKPPELPKEWALTARAVFTTGERRVYRMLKETLPNHVILSKLPLVRFCQPIDLGQLRYWYDMLGTNYVSFAICAPNGRVLAAIDIDKDRSTDANPHLRRSMKIKRSVLRSCRVRYLRTPAGKLPSTAEIHALLPKAGVAGGGAPIPDNFPEAQSLSAAVQAAAAQAAVHFAVSQVEPRATGSTAKPVTPLQSPLADAGRISPGGSPLFEAILPEDTPDDDTPDHATSPVFAQEPVFAPEMPGTPEMTATPEQPAQAALDATQAAPAAESEPVGVDTPLKSKPGPWIEPELELKPQAQPSPESVRRSDNESDGVPPASFNDARFGEVAMSHPKASDREALTRAREALTSTVATRRAQRNIMWQESSVFQDSFFVLDSRLGDSGNDSTSGDLDLDSHPLPLPLPNTSAHAEPTVVKVTLEDMVTSERLSKKGVDVEEARYASADRT